jgi:hypothetical protein
MDLIKSVESEKVSELEFAFTIHFCCNSEVCLGGLSRQWQQHPVMHLRHCP